MFLCKLDDILCQILAFRIGIDGAAGSLRTDQFSLWIDGTPELGLTIQSLNSRRKMIGDKEFTIFVPIDTGV